MTYDEAIEAARSLRSALNRGESMWLSEALDTIEAEHARLRSQIAYLLDGMTHYEDEAAMRAEKESKL